MIKEEKIIEIGKYKVDVSNISVKRKRISIKMWNTLFNIKQDKDGEAIRTSTGSVQEAETKKEKTERQATRGLLAIGLYLLRQDIRILNRRFKLTDAIKEYFKRYFITIRYIESLTDKEMNDFVGWIYEEITGAKKKVVDLMSPMMDQLETLALGMTEEELLHFSTFLMNSFLEQVKQYQSLKVGQKKA